MSRYLHVCIKNKYFCCRLVMGEARQYCLKWNNHPRNVATVFDRWGIIIFIIIIIIIGPGRPSAGWAQVDCREGKLWGVSLRLASCLRRSARLWFGREGSFSEIQRHTPTLCIYHHHIHPHDHPYHDDDPDKILLVNWRWRLTKNPDRLRPTPLSNHCSLKCTVMH